MKTLRRPGAAVADLMGADLAMTASFMAVGAPGVTDTETDEGAVYLYPNDCLHSWHSTRTKGGNDTAAGDLFGQSVDIWDSYIVAGAPSNGTGSAYVFDRNWGGADVWFQRTA